MLGSLKNEQCPKKLFISFVDLILNDGILSLKASYLDNKT